MLKQTGLDLLLEDSLGALPKTSLLKKSEPGLFCLMRFLREANAGEEWDL